MNREFSLFAASAREWGAGEGLLFSSTCVGTARQPEEYFQFNSIHPILRISNRLCIRLAGRLGTINYYHCCCCYYYCYYYHYCYLLLFGRVIQSPGYRGCTHVAGWLHKWWWRRRTETDGDGAWLSRVHPSSSSLVCVFHLFHLPSVSVCLLSLSVIYSLSPAKGSLTSFALSVSVRPCPCLCLGLGLGLGLGLCLASRDSLAGGLN